MGSWMSENGVFLVLNFRAKKIPESTVIIGHKPEFMSKVHVPLIPGGLSPCSGLTVLQLNDAERLKPCLALRNAAAALIIIIKMRYILNLSRIWDTACKNPL